MSVERFSAWYFEQPELVQRLVLLGPPFVVSLIIGAALGGRLRLIPLAWRFNPTVASALDTLRAQAEAEQDSEWTEAAKASVDELVARRNGPARR